MSGLTAAFSLRAPTNKNPDPITPLERLEWWSWRVTVAIIVGIVVEAGNTIIFWWPGESYWDAGSKLIADALIAGGLAVEAICASRTVVESRNEKAESDEKVAAANERASKADLSRIELEAKLQPRMTDQRQFDLIQSLKGRLVEVSIIREADAESQWYAGSLRDAFFASNIRVGIFIYDPGMRGARPSEIGVTLVDVFRGREFAVAMVSGAPLDVPMMPMEYPAIMVGGRFPVLPAHIARAMQMADAAYAHMEMYDLLPKKDFQPDI
jgi:hypothetical protein